MTPSEVSDAMLQTPTPRDGHIAKLAAKLAFPRYQRVAVYVLFFLGLPMIFGFVLGIFHKWVQSMEMLQPETTIGLLFLYLLFWIVTSMLYNRRRLHQLIDVARYGERCLVEAVTTPGVVGPKRITSVYQLLRYERRRHVVTVGSYQGEIMIVGFTATDLFVKPGCRRALALHANGIVDARVKWKTNVPTATALSQ